MKTCRLCLQMHVKVSFIGDTEALKFLQAILCKRGFDVLSTHYICVFCKHLLNKFYFFIQKIIKAQIKKKKKVRVIDLENSSSFSHNLSYKKIDNFYVGNKVSAENYKNTIEDNDIHGDNSLLVSRKKSVDYHSAASDTSSNNEDHKPIHFLVDENVVLPNRLRGKRKKQAFNEFEEKDGEDDLKKGKQYKKKEENSDVDFNPGNNSSNDYSSESSEDVQYHDNGRRMKQRSPEKIYPRTCEKVRVIDLDKKIDNFYVGNKVSAENYKNTIEDNDILGDNSLLVSRKKSVDYHSAASDTSCNNEDHKPIHFLVDENVVLPNRLRGKRKKQAFNEFEEKDSEDDLKKGKQYKKKEENSDDDFNPGNNSSNDYSSESSEDVQYHDNGRCMRQRSPERIYPRTCEECDYEIYDKSNHYHHYMLFHKDKEYPYKKRPAYLCKFCGISKTRIAHLRDHERTHGKPTVKCDECGKMFSTNRRLKCHQWYHKPPKYECDYCHKNFYTKSDLERHIRTHTGDKPYKCHICGEAFAHKGNVRIHIRNRHEQEPIKKGRKQKKTSGTKRKMLKKKKV